LVICNEGDCFLRHRLFVVSRLVSLGHDVTVLAGGNPIHAQHTQGWKYHHVRIEHLSFSPLGDLVLTWRSIRTIFDLRPDAIHLITLKPAVFSGIASAISSAMFGYPQTILITLPGLGRMLNYPKSPDEQSFPVASALTLGALRLIAANSAAQFSFETRHDYEFFERHGIVNPKNATVIEGAGVDSSRFYPALSPVGCIKMRVLFAGRLMKSKGLGVFMATARELSDRKDIEFLVAGMSDDKDPDALRAEDLAQSDYIRFLGHVEDMPSLLRSCDIVCLPTRYGEGIPRILIEAAATGLASIASSHPGCLEIITDGATGQILHGGSAAELTRQLPLPF
jgi:glycosyltransferase involved in cell wall biosynthesis